MDVAKVILRDGQKKIQKEMPVDEAQCLARLCGAEIVTVTWDLSGFDPEEARQELESQSQVAWPQTEGKETSPLIPGRYNLV